MNQTRKPTNPSTRTRSHLVSIASASPAPPFLENIPVTFAPRPSSAPALTPDTQISATAKSLSDLCSASWISFNSTTGSLAYAFSTLNHSSSSMPVLLIEETPTAHKLCQHLLDSATVVQVPHFSLVPSLIRSGLAPANNQAPTVIPHDTVSQVHSFLHNTSRISGADFHCPHNDLAFQLEWLHQALSTTAMLAQSKQLCTAIISIPMTSSRHSPARTRSLRYIMELPLIMVYSLWRDLCLLLWRLSLCPSLDSLLLTAHSSQCAFTCVSQHRRPYQLHSPHRCLPKHH